MGRQLNIRAGRGKTLVRGDKVTRERVEADRRTLNRLIEEAGGDRPPGLSSDRRDLHDDAGLPF